MPFPASIFPLGILLLTAAWAAAAPAETVAIPASLHVDRGRLQLQWANPSAEETLVQLYGDADLAALFRERVLAEINATLAALRPIVDWRPPFGHEPEQHVGEWIKDPAERAVAAEFSGPLHDWLVRFARAERGRFVHWLPTSRDPAAAEETDSDADRSENLEPLASFLPFATTSLIGHLHRGELEELSRFDGPVVRVHFHRPAPLLAVKIVGMDFPDSTARSDAERREFARYREERARLEAQLNRWSSRVQLAWNDDLAVQRMMAVFRAHGFWDGFARAPKGAPRQVHWLSIDPASPTEAAVHLPHLCFLIFEPGADDNCTLLAVAEKLLRPAEQEVVAQSLALWDKFPRFEDTPAAQKRLQAVIQRQQPEGRRFVDLFALSSYLASNTAGPRERYSPLPVRQEWLAARFAEIETLGKLVAAVPSATDENRPVPSRGRPRKAFERGGIDVWISPADAAPASDSTDESAPTLAAWLKRHKLRAEFGLSYQDSQPTTFIARLSTIDDVALGKLGFELRYQERFSGELEWKPLADSERDTKLLPSTVSIFRDASTPRKVDGREISLEHDGIRISKRHPLQGPTGLAVGRRALELSAQIAHVRDLTAASAPTENEFSASLGFTAGTSENPWDARNYAGLRLRATGIARGRSDVDFWTVLEAGGQLQKPAGDWSYFAGFDARTALGSPAPDALPWVGGTDGVRGIRPFAAPARTRIVVRQELWMPVPWLDRDVGSEQKWFGAVYETIKPALFFDAAWASSLHEAQPARPWFFSPGVGVRLLLGPAHLSVDYAYGFARPARLGRHRFSLGINARY